MSAKIKRNTNPRQVVRLARKIRIKRSLRKNWGLVSRLVPYRSNRFLYAQVIDDATGKTVASANTGEKDFGISGSKKGADAAKKLGEVIAERAKAQKVERVIFDRNGYNYHGTIKAFADAAREKGLNF